MNEPRRYVEPDGSHQIASAVSSTARAARTLFHAVVLGTLILIVLLTIFGLTGWFALQSR